jgi:hypothetical protein
VGGSQALQDAEERQVIEKGTWWQSPSGHNRVEIRGHLGVSTLLVWNEKDMAEKYMQAELLDDWVQVPPPLPKEVTVTDPKTGGKKGSKPEAHALVPVWPQDEVSRVYGKGAEKYEAWNWAKGYAWSLSISAAQRHFNAWKRGVRLDEDGLHHLAHVQFHMNSLMEFERLELGTDDRWIK